MGVRAIGGVAAALLLATVAATASAATPEPTPDQSARGKEWFAVGSAFGNATAAQDGATVDWTGAVLAGFKFAVDDAGRAAGGWVLTGAATQKVSAGGVEVAAELEYDGGGDVGGDESVLVATGAVTTTGFEPRTGLDIDNTNEIAPLGIEIEVFCNEMWGTWEVTVADAFQDAGFDTSMDGTLVGHVRFDGFSDEALAVLAANGFTIDLLNRWSGDYSQADRVEYELVTLEAHVTALTSAAERLVDTYPNWSGPDAYAVVDQIHVLLNVLRNISGCARSALGDGTVETWSDSLHGSLNRLIGMLVDLNLFPGAPPRPQSLMAPATPPPPEPAPDPGQATLGYQQLADFATRSAVIGAGALDPTEATEAEAALIAHGSRLLEGLDAVGGTDDDRRRVYLVGATMGWEFDVAGTKIDPVAALIELGLGS